MIRISMELSTKIPAVTTARDCDGPVDEGEHLNPPPYGGVWVEKMIGEDDDGTWWYDDDDEHEEVPEWDYNHVPAPRLGQPCCPSDEGPILCPEWEGGFPRDWEDELNEMPF
jgi:hypothetical protein